MFRLDWMFRTVFLCFLALVLAEPSSAQVDGSSRSQSDAPLMDSDPAAAQSLIDREFDSPTMDPDLACDRLEAAAVSRPDDDGVWADYLDVLTERAAELLRSGEVEQAWQRIERGKCQLFERWSHAPLPETPLADLQIWLDGARATYLVFSDSRRLPTIAFVIDAKGIQGYEVKENSTESFRAATNWARRSQLIASELLADDLVVSIRAAERLFVAAPVGAADAAFSAALDFVAMPAAVADFQSLAPGQGPPVSFLPAASFLRDRISPRMRSGSGYTLFAADLSMAQNLAVQKDRVWIGPDANWTQFDDKDTRDSDVIHFGIPLTWVEDRNELGIGTDVQFVKVDSLAPELATDWLSAFELSSSSAVFTQELIYKMLQRRSRSFALNVDALPAEMAMEIGEVILGNLRGGMPRDKAMREARAELHRRGHSLEDVYALQLWGAGNLPVYALVAPRGITGLVIGWAIFLISGFWIVSFIGRRLSPTAESSEPSESSPTA